MAAVAVVGFAISATEAIPQNAEPMKQRIIELQAQVASLTARLTDWPQLGHFKEANREFKSSAHSARPIVFIGDSITANWGAVPSGFFPGENYVNRGLGGQVTGQMLLRFQQDVLGLDPAAVVILGGVNELSWGSRAERFEIIETNIGSMAELAQFHHVPVIIASLTPLARGRGGADGNSVIMTLNNRLRQYSAEHNCIYLDYFAAMTHPDGSTKEELFADGTHPNDEGYKIMARAAQSAISRLRLRP
jgi:lysophospholipase L1-like esterase